MKKNDQQSDVSALKIRKTTQSNGAKLQHDKILICVISRKMKRAMSNKAERK